MRIGVLSWFLDETPGDGGLIGFAPAAQPRLMENSGLDADGCRHLLV